MKAAFWLLLIAVLVLWWYFRAQVGDFLSTMAGAFKAAAGTVTTAAGDVVTGVGLTGKKWVDAFTQQEGGGATDRNVRNNNPGNLRPPNGQGNFWDGQTGVDAQGFAVFGTLSAGVRVLLMNIQLKAAAHPDWTLQNLAANWLGNADPTRPEKTTEGDPFAYAAGLAKSLGVSTAAKIGDLWKGTNG